MNAPAMPDVEAAVWRTVQRINEAWVQSRIEELRELLHSSMVIVPPDRGEPVRGQASCIDSYRDFIVQARVLRFEELTPVIDVFGDTAVATYDFEIFYELGGTWTTQRGRELIVLMREDDRWWAVWRTQLPVGTYPL